MEQLPVIIVEDQYGLSAVFPTLAWSNTNTISCFDSVSGHGAGTKEWYKTTKIAKQNNSKIEFMKRLKQIYFDVKLKEYKRWIQDFDLQRNQKFKNNAL
jgi:hypothetical protein